MDPNGWLPPVERLIVPGLVIAGMICSLIGRAIWGGRPRREATAGREPSKGSQLTKAWAGFVVRYRWPIIVVFGGLSLLPLYERPKIYTDPIGEFPKDDPLYVQYRKQEHLGTGRLAVISHSFRCLEELSRVLPRDVVAPAVEQTAPLERKGLFFMRPEDLDTLKDLAGNYPMGSVLNAQSAGELYFEYGSLLKVAVIKGKTAMNPRDVDTRLNALSRFVDDTELILRSGAAEGGEVVPAVDRDLPRGRARRQQVAPRKGNPGWGPFPVETMLLPGDAGAWLAGRGFILPITWAYEGLEAQARPPAFYTMYLRVTAEHTVDPNVGRAVKAAMLPLFAQVAKEKRCTTEVKGGLQDGRGIVHEEPDFEIGGVSVGSGEIFDLVMDDLWKTGLATSLIVLFVFTIFLRRIAIGLIAMLVTSVPVLIAWGLGGLILKDITVVASLIMPLLIGLGDDICLHMVTRLRNLEGEEFKEALAELLGPTIWAGSVFAAAGLALSAAYIMGPQRMGALAAIGMACTTAAAIMLAPALMSVVPAKYRRDRDGLLKNVADAITEYVQVGAYVVHKRPRVVVGLVAGLVGAGCMLSFGYPGIKMVWNPYKVLAEVPGKRWLHRSQEATGYWPVPTAVYPSEGDGAKSRIRTDLLVGKAESLERVMPGLESPGVVEEARGILLREIKTKSTRKDRELVEGLRKFDEGLDAMGEMMGLSGQVSSYYRVRDLREKVRSLITYAKERNGPERGAIRDLDRWAAASVAGGREKLLRMETTRPGPNDLPFFGEGGRERVWVYPREAVVHSTDDKIEEWVHHTEAMGSTIGAEKIIYHYIRRMKSSVVLCVVLGFVMILLANQLGARSWKANFIILSLPLAASVLTTAGMAVLGVPLDTSSIWAFALLLGIGLDDAVHVMHVGPRGLVPILPPMLVTTLTTVGAGVTLLFAGTPGFRSFGWFYIFSLTAVWLLSVFFLPCLMQVMKLNAGGEKSPDSEPPVRSA